MISHSDKPPPRLCLLLLCLTATSCRLLLDCQKSGSPSPLTTDTMCQRLVSDRRPPARPRAQHWSSTRGEAETGEVPIGAFLQTHREDYHVSPSTPHLRGPSQLCGGQKKQFQRSTGAGAHKVQSRFCYSFAASYVPEGDRCKKKEGVTVETVAVQLTAHCLDANGMYTYKRT